MELQLSDTQKQVFHKCEKQHTPPTQALLTFPSSVYDGIPEDVGTYVLMAALPFRVNCLTFSTSYFMIY